VVVMNYFVSLFFLIVCLSFTYASEGDIHPFMIQCRQNCESKHECHKTDNRFTKEAPFYLKLMAWDCAEDCTYLCMRNHTLQRKADGEPVLQYYGKWPFIRVFGIQELFSSVFSWGNAIPNIIFFFKFRRIVPDDYYLKNIFLCFAVSNVFTWTFSTIFHARDFKWTEALDYYFADLAWCFICVWTTIRFFDIRSTQSIVMIFLIFGAILFHLIYYLTFIKFDYGYNTTVGVILAIWQCVLWYTWAFMNWSKSKYAWKIVLSESLSWMAGTMELFDFPPFFDILDGHAIWHGLTIPVGYLLWDWILEDAKSNHKRLSSEKIL